MTRQKRYLLILCLFLLLLAISVIAGPHFLLYSSDYKKTDTIILLLGPDFSARQKEAYRIINEGKSQYLIIPAYRKIYKVNFEGSIKYLSPQNYLPNPNNKISPRNSIPSFLEDTHIEIIEAKRVMSAYGLRSAIFVSSPYHMRRIKLIAASVFDSGDSEFYFVPTSFEKAPAHFWELSWSEWKKVVREYGKILWFKIYSFWV